MNTTDDALELRLQRAARVTDAALESAEIRSAVEALAMNARATAGVLLPKEQRVVTARKRRHRSVAIAASAVSALLLSGGVATANGWVGDLSTGFFGKPGMTENDTSEFLNMGSKEVGPLLDRIAAEFPWAPGTSMERYKDSFYRPNTVMQEKGIRGQVAMISACTWERAWLEAHREKDEVAQRRAHRVLTDVPTWPAVVAVDGGGVVETYREIVETTRVGDDSVVARNVALNCPSAPQ